MTVTPRGSSVLRDGHLPRLASEITAGMIMTPRALLVTVCPETPSAVALGKMANTFDQLPVLVEGKLAGM